MQLQELHDVGVISSELRLHNEGWIFMNYGLLGEKLAHSYSPEIHAYFGDYEYGLFEVASNDLEDFFGSTIWSGINVTIPYKQAVIAFCDELSDAARGIGSINTIIRRADGTLYGDNTDAYGFAYLIKDMVVKDKKILVLGSGGSCRTVRHVLLQQGASEVIVVSRVGEHNYGNLERHDDAEVIINTTPVGMYPDNGSSPLLLRHFSKIEVVVDLIYNPTKTALLLEAEQLGITAISGLAMLVAQAAKASELFTGQPVATELIDKVIAQIHCKTQNLILIGMPGCGKTTIATELAAISGRKIIDTDHEIEKLVGKSIVEIFADDGEEQFREYEAMVIKQFGAEAGLIIATGGGCIKTSANYDCLRQNGLVFWLERPIAALPRDGRPLSVGDLEIIYNERKPLYHYFADKVVVNDKMVETVAQQIWREFYEYFDC